MKKIKYLIDENFDNIKDSLDEVLKKYGNLDDINVEDELFLYSVLFYKTSLDKIKLLKKMVKITIKSNLDKNTKYFLLYQYVALAFAYGLKDKKLDILIRKLYLQIYNIFLNHFDKNKLFFIDKDKRDKKLVFVLTQQVLGNFHAPTRRIVDKCQNLQDLGYDVMLINTAEIVSFVNGIKLLYIQSGNYLEKLSSKDYITYNNYKIPFIQFPQYSPTIESINMLINIVNKYRPLFIVSFGSATLTGDILSNIVPVFSFKFGSDLPLSQSPYLIKQSPINKQDKKISKKFNIKKIIQTQMDYMLKEQKNTLSRDNFNIPKNKKILVIIGNRLDREVNEKFLNTILKTTKYNTFILFIGDFFNYNNIVKKNKLLQKHSLFIGMQDDILAILDFCDIYVNPPRLGGGASAFEALSKKIPVVTLDYGDVYITTGEKFGVKNYKQMFKEIKKLVTDDNYYKYKSQLAFKQYKILADSKANMKKFIDSIGRYL